ncbi:MAG: helix-turn-helix transcriptional regulator [Chitinophagaceae bacterium]|nr:helix-turn-helix transcriptional regulator [Chitinophagaceae bacterium]
MDITTTIGKNIRQYRLQRGLKLETLAKEIAVSKATMSQIENGQAEITVRRIEKIAKVLEVEYNLLVTARVINMKPDMQYTADNTAYTTDIVLMEKILHLSEEILRLRSK